MNKFQRWVLFVLSLALLILFYAVTVQAGQIAELKKSSVAYQHVAQQLYFEVYGLQFSDSDNPAVDDEFLDLFNSRIDQSETLGKNLFYEVYGDYNTQDKNGEFESRIDDFYRETEQWEWYISRHNQRLQILEYAVRQLEGFERCVTNGQCPSLTVAYYLHECAVVAWEKGGDIDVRTYYYDECAKDIYEEK